MFRYDTTPLKDAKIDVSDNTTHWYFVGSNGNLYYISYDSNNHIFTIGTGMFTIDENNIIQAPKLVFY